MILKSFELKKINLKKNKIILIYGKNEGLKNESLNLIVKDSKHISNFDEKEVLENSISFLESTLSRSLFENEKIIIIKRATDKILKIVEEIESRNIEDINIIINAENLEKKSKLRSFFEKSKNHICIPFYPDDERSLSKICLNYFQAKKIPISQSSINLIVSKCNGDRGILQNELKKIELFSINKKKISKDEITKLINLLEDHDISVLVDNCLAKNENKTINILSENNFSNEDSVLIIKIFLNKTKKILKLSSEFEKNQNIDATINSSKPPIFWKDKEITKQQIYKWKPKDLKNLIYKINEIELHIKKNLNNSLNLTTDFILEQCSSKSNS
jgi:DNA polymerase-3 subunit delta